MKKYIIILLTTLIIMGCSAIDKTPTLKKQTEDKKPLTEITAITKIKAKFGHNIFPDEPTKVQGLIKGGGPAQGKQIPADLETKVVKESNNSYLVTFTETWNARDFKGEDGNKQFLSHYWKYQVTKDTMKRIDEGGNIPPDYVK